MTGLEDMIRDTGYIEVKWYSTRYVYSTVSYNGYTMCAVVVVGGGVK